MPLLIDNITWNGENFVYQNADTATSNIISSDFGPRFYNGQDWHSGVDFNPKSNNQDLGDHIRSLESGNIQWLLVTASNFVFISIDGAGQHDFGYMHLFKHFNSIHSIQDIGSDGLKTGDLILYPNQNNDGDYVIIYAPEDGDTTVIGDNPGSITHRQYNI